MNVFNGTTSIINRNRTRNVLTQTSQIATFIYSKKQLGRLWAVKPLNYYYKDIHSDCHYPKEDCSQCCTTYQPAWCLSPPSPVLPRQQWVVSTHPKHRPNPEENSPNFPVYDFISYLITVEIIHNKICAPCSSLIHLIDFSILVYPAMSEWQPRLMLIRGCMWASTLSSAQLNGIIRAARHHRYVLISVSNEFGSLLIFPLYVSLLFNCFVIWVHAVPSTCNIRRSGTSEDSVWHPLSPRWGICCSPRSQPHTVCAPEVQLWLPRGHWT